MIISKRRLAARLLCVVIFAGAVWGALRLSHPPGPPRPPRARAMQTPPAPSVETDRDVMTLQVGTETRRYRFRETAEGLVVTEVEDE